MGIVSVGDMARSFQHRLLTASLKTDIQRLNKELTTGQREDLSAATSGDFGPLANIERVLSTHGARSLALNEAKVITDMAQTTLATIQDHVVHVETELLSIQGNTSPVTLSAHSGDAKARFSSVVQALNTHAGGRTLMGGAATDRSALADPEDMLADLIAATVVETSAAGVSAAVDDWFFTPGGGFETSGYLGSTDPMGSFPIEEGASAQMSIRADDTRMREVLSGLAKAALVNEGVLGGDQDEQAGLMALAGQDLTVANDGATLMRAELGSVQARIDESSARLEAEKSALELARNDLVGVDPYEAATNLEASLNQLETLYTVTSRMSRLSFTDYIR